MWLSRDEGAEGGSPQHRPPEPRGERGSFSGWRPLLAAAAGEERGEGRVPRGQRLWGPGMRRSLAHPRSAEASGSSREVEGGTGPDSHNRPPLPRWQPATMVPSRLLFSDKQRKPPTQLKEVIKMRGRIFCATRQVCTTYTLKTTQSLSFAITPPHTHSKMFGFESVGETRLKNVVVQHH